MKTKQMQGLRTPNTFDSKTQVELSKHNYMWKQNPE